jgi:hypothetical protein
MNIFNLKLHHIGIVISKNQVKKIENINKKKFILDKKQGVRVTFIKDKIKNFYIEYIVREGKSKNQALGFNHLCFNIKNRQNLKKVEKFIMKNSLGYPISKLVKSGSKECNMIIFYFFKNLGIIEFNILKL